MAAKAKGSLADLARNVGSSYTGEADGTDVVDVISFVEGKNWMDLQLYPVQRVILKAHYGIALDDSPPGFSDELLMTYSLDDLRALAEDEKPELEKVSDAKLMKDAAEKFPTRSTKDATIRAYLINIIMRRTVLIYRGDAPWRKRMVDAAWLTEREYLAYLYESGRSNIREVIPGVERRELILSIGRRSGKCVEGDSLVLTGDGIFRIEELGDPEGPETQPLKIKVAQEGNKKSQSSHFYNGGVKHTRRVTTLCGYRIAGTDNHRVKVMREDGTIQWRYIADIQEGDYVGIHRKSNLWSASYVEYEQEDGRFPQRLTEEHGYLLGSLAATQSKCVPKGVLRSPESVVCAFLRGLFESSEGNSSLSTESVRLAREVQVLLANLGIVAKLEPSKSRFTVTAQGLRSQQLFYDKIGIDVSSSSETNTELLPYQEAWCRRLLESVPEIQKRSTLTERLSSDEMTYPRLRKVLATAVELDADQEVIEHFESLIDADYFWDPVASIEEAEAPVYDLVVPEGVSFVANGLTNHNTHISSCIAAYETYKLISKGNPQKFYGLPDGEVIQLISVATDRDQAGILYRKVSAHFKNTQFFRSYRSNETQTNSRFQTPVDIQEYGRWDSNNGAHSSLNVTFRSCVAKGLRGAGNIVVILDEVAHFTDAGQSSAEEVYNAVSPSLSTFSPKDPDDKLKALGEVEARMILISSPMGKQGQFYELFQVAMRGGEAAKNMLAIQAPTWEVNPTVPAVEFEKNYAKDPNTFRTEYGGEFTDRTLGWIEVSGDLIACVDPTLKKKVRGLPRVGHFMGIDFAMAKDGTGIAIGHVEGEKVVLDYIEERRAGIGRHVNDERLDFDELADWVKELSGLFLIEEGIFDQWAGPIFEQALHKRGLTQIQMKNFTTPEKSAIFQNFKDLMYEERLALYDDRPPDEKHINLAEALEEQEQPADEDEMEERRILPASISYLKELMQLQATRKSKSIIEVEAPNIKGKHDDRSDALVRMVWLATKRLGNANYIAGAASKVGQKLPHRYSIKAQLKARQTGSHEARQFRNAKGGRRGGSTRRVRGGRLKG
jgi:intein/homing endonuclease